MWKIPNTRREMENNSGTYVENKGRDDEEDEGSCGGDARQAQNSSSWASANAKKATTKKMASLSR